MKALARWSVEHRVSVNLIMIFLIVAGIQTVLNMKREMFPQFSLDMINIRVSYPGASPEEIEEGICIKIEEQIKSIENVKTMYSTSIEGHASVTLKFETGTDIRKKLDEIETEINLINSFPEQAEDPIITEIKNNEPAIYLALYGDVHENILKNIAEKIRDDLVQKDEISLASIIGMKNYEISIEVPEKNLRRFNLSFDQVANAVRTGSLDLPGGEIKTKGRELLVRAKGKLYSGMELESIPVVTREDGTVIRLGEIAKIIDGFEDKDIKARFNGKPAALILVKRTDSQDTVAISEAVKEYINENRDYLPENVSMTYWFDMAEMVQERIDLLLKNGYQGILLVFLVLAVFLDLGLSFWVASGIPISFMGAFLVLNYLGASINMLSLFGFIMTLGILVDDAIIVGENVYTHHSMGKSSKEAVLDGIGQIGTPVVMAVTTTIVAFAPLMYIAGVMGKFISIMPQAVICILCISLVEAFVILPAHLEYTLRPPVKKNKKPFRLLFFWLTWLKEDILAGHKWVRARVARSLTKVIVSFYTPVLKYCVKNRYLSFSIGTGLLIVSIGLLIGERVPFVFFPKTDSNWIICEIVYPLGTPFESTEKAVKQIEKGAFELNDFFRDRIGEDIIVSNFSQVGIIPRRDWKPGIYGGHCGEIWIEIKPASKRPGISAPEVTAKWREFAGDIPGTEKLSFLIIGGGPGGNPIEIQLLGDDLEQLQEAADALKKEISKYPGTSDINDNFRPGKTEQRISIKKGAKSLGITMADIAAQLRQAYYGDEVLKIQRGKDDIKVMIRYSREERESESSIDRIRIRTRDGREIPLNQVANIEMERGYSSIQRIDRKRSITVIADIDEDIANARKIIQDLKTNYLDGFVEKFPGIAYDLEGQAKRTQESIDSLIKGFFFAGMIIFFLLASQFKSYIQSMIIITAIPLGLIGAIAGHYIMGLDITMISLFGIVALSGIVVNDSLILINFINSEIRQGKKTFDSVIKAGQNRFRPVLLTSVTTVAGLFPLLLEKSFQAQFLIPMAVSISFGLIAATGLTLIFVPSLYVIIEDIKNIFAED